jgi:hypothetical protein
MSLTAIDLATSSQRFYSQVSQLMGSDAPPHLLTYLHMLTLSMILVVAAGVAGLAQYH